MGAAPRSFGYRTIVPLLAASAILAALSLSNGTDTGIGETARALPSDPALSRITIARPDPASDAASPAVAASATPAATARATLIARAQTPTPARPATPTPATFANPVIDRDFPDPDVLRVGDTYYAYATNTSGANVQVARSSDLVSWKALPDALPSLPDWARAGRTWAPDVSATASGYVMYFVAWHAASGRECIGVATAAAASGPFRAAPDPFVCPLAAGGAIDPASFVDADGARYLLWKNDGNCCAITTRLFVQRLSSDGLALTSDPVALLAADRAWEGGIIEAPTLWLESGTYHLFYSANGYAGAGYAIGHAVASSPLGPFVKDASPWMQSAPNVVGPGGQDVVRAADGSTWLVYHTWSASHAYREMDLGMLAWNGGRPILSGTRGTQPAP